MVSLHLLLSAFGTLPVCPLPAPPLRLTVALPVMAPRRMYAAGVFGTRIDYGGQGSFCLGNVLHTVRSYRTTLSIALSFMLKLDVLLLEQIALVKRVS